MSEARKQRQRAQRKEKRQIKRELIAQAEKYKSDTTTSKYIEFVTNFSEFALTETNREIKNAQVENERIEVLKKALTFAKKLESKKYKEVV